MTRELDKLLTAAKAIWLGCGETEVGNLHRAITDFEAAQAKLETRGSDGFEKAEFAYFYDILMKEKDRKVFEVFLHNNYNIILAALKRSFAPSPAAREAPDPYDFENAGLRKEP